MYKFGRLKYFSNYLFIYCLICFSVVKNVSGLLHVSDELVVYLSQFGIHGTISFIWSPKNHVYIQTNLTLSEKFERDSLDWLIYEYPISYNELSNSARCLNLGKQLFSLSDHVGEVNLPDFENNQWNLTLSYQEFSSWYRRSLLLKFKTSNNFMCGTLTSVDESKNAYANSEFTGPVEGSINFFWLASQRREKISTMVYSTLRWSRTSERSDSFHDWKIFAIEHLESKLYSSDNFRCDSLRGIYTVDDNSEVKVGEVGARLGEIKITSSSDRISSGQTFMDDSLGTLTTDLISGRNFFVVLYEKFKNKQEVKILGCSRIRIMRPKTLKATLNRNGIKGSIVIKNQNKFVPSTVTISIEKIDTPVLFKSSQTTNLAVDLKVTSLPPNNENIYTHDYCDTKSVGGTYNPLNMEHNDNGFSQDNFEVGDLSGKHFKNIGFLNGTFWDLFLPLIGKNSIARRGILLALYFENTQLTACSPLCFYESDIQVQEISALITFKYPIAGRISFFQIKNRHWEDLTIFVEYLIHSDGKRLNTTHDHRWSIHQNPPDKDFYDWQNRCLSAGKVFDENIGKLSEDLGTLTIAGSRRNSLLSRKLFTNSQLALSGSNSIVGKSLVIYYDQDTRNRGDRFACSKIIGQQSRKAVAKDWFPNIKNYKISGKIEFYQQSPHHLVNIEVDLKGIVNTTQMYMCPVPVEKNLEFPCEESSLLKMYNPNNIDTQSEHIPSTYDFYPAGDLNGKFRLLPSASSKIKNYFNDSFITLYGYNNIIGKSVVFQSANNRLACSTIERGYSLKESHQVTAIASFHHPEGYAYGYVRFSQLFGYDGAGETETVIETNLRYPGLYNRNSSIEHNWKVFVNPVSVDAIVKEGATRCVAGGYVWSPYYTQLADPLNDKLYKAECGIDNPFRCHAGDISGRLGTINIGLGRQTFTDYNLPLDGAVSIIGRSVVIFEPLKSSLIQSCANIEFDYDLVKFINLEKPPRFVLSQFLEEVRSVMGIPDWFLEVDSRKTKYLHGDACIQILVHFRGPHAHHLEIDFSRLMATGRLDSASIYIPGYVNTKRKSTISYKTCSLTDNTKSRKTARGKSSSKNISNCSHQTRSKLLFVFIVKLFIIHFLK